MTGILRSLDEATLNLELIPGRSADFFPWLLCTDHIQYVHIHKDSTLLRQGQAGTQAVAVQFHHCFSSTSPFPMCYRRPH